MDSLSFDNMTDLYGETRSFDVGCFSLSLDYLCEQFPPCAFPRLLEPGIGSGRIAFPLAERGYRVTGVDISRAMLSLLERRKRESVRPLEIESHLGDATALPFADEAFDLCVAAHLFYFIRDWPKAACEMVRVTRGGGAIILMHTGTGMEIPFLNDRYKELCAKKGCPIPTVGAESTQQVVDYLAQLGYCGETIRDRWNWVARVRLDKALGHLRSRAYSFTTFASQSVHAEAVETLLAEIEGTHGGLSAEIDVPNRISLVVFRK